MLNPTLRLKLTAFWNVRGRGSQLYTVQPGTPVEKELARFLVAAISEDEELRVGPELRSRLKELGILTSEETLPGPCDFDFTYPGTRRLLPNVNRLNYDASTPLASLVVNPLSYLQRGRRAPRELRGRIEQASFIEDEDVVLWVDDPGPRVLAPYRVPGDVSQQLIELRGKPLAASVMSGLSPLKADHALRVELLQRANILVPRDWEESRRAAWEAVVRESRASLRRDGHVVLRGVLNPVQLGLMRRYYRAADLAGAFHLDDGQVERRKTQHNERVATFVHHQLVGLVNRIVPAPIKPSYSYLGLYEPGAVLARHVDRAQCEWNVSMPFDADPETDAETAWPIHIEVRGVARPIRLGLGDALLYRGTEVPHWRDAQPADHRTTVCFFHFVDEAFSLPTD